MDSMQMDLELWKNLSGGYLKIFTEGNYWNRSIKRDLNFLGEVNGRN
jgi:hypothetical protein